ncbi:helix-turn-helix domain-containing protein, partial [Staphylococcus sp. GDY8P57P]
MSDKVPHLTAYSEEQRQKAMDKYRLIAPYLNREKSLRAVAEDSDVSKRTLQYWVSQYEQFGLVGLIRKRRRDSGIFKVEKEVQEEIKNLILNHKRNSVTSIHRKICET